MECKEISPLIIRHYFLNRDAAVPPLGFEPRPHSSKGWRAAITPGRNVDGSSTPETLCHIWQKIPNCLVSHHEISPTWRISSTFLRCVAGRSPSRIHRRTPVLFLHSSSAPPG